MQSRRIASRQRALAAAVSALTVLGGSCAAIATAAGPAREPRPVEPMPPDRLAPPRSGEWSGSFDGVASSPGPRWRTSTADAEASAHSPAWSGYEPQPEAGMAASERLEIRLQQARFDPLREAAPLLPALAGATRGAGERDYHLVQFEGPIRAEWRQSLLDRGAEIVDYVPDFAYLVRADRRTLASIAALPDVRWSGPFAPAYRLANDLVEPALAARGGEVELLVRGFAGEPADSVRAGLVSAGARILGQGKDSGGGVLFEVTSAPSALQALASIRAVAWIERKPEFVLANQVARSNSATGKDAVEQQTGYFGEGQIVAVVDTGLSTGDAATVHADFAGRVVGATWGPGSCGHWAGVAAHGTHVSGSVLGSGARSGSNPAAGQYAGSQAGIAPRAGLVMWSTCQDFSGLPADLYGGLWAPLYGFADELRVSNNSWGTTGDANHGTYSVLARETDRFIHDYQDMVVVFAAGNDGTDADADGVSDFGTIMPPSTAKNVIAVGASENMRGAGGFNPGGACAYWGECWPQDFTVNPIAGDLLSNNLNGMAGFSGRGPTLSNRLKPDLVAPGTNVVSARSEVSSETGWGVANAYYLFEGGTSMAAPLVSGGAAIVREYFQRRFAHDPSAALVKATLLNASRDMTPGQYGAGAFQDVWRRPDINQGWGRMDLRNALLFAAARKASYLESFPGLQTGQQMESPIAVGSGGAELRVTLAWSDAPGAEATQGALVDDLDLELVAPGGVVHYGFGGLAGEQRDRYNNVEEVRLPSAAAGQYVVRVRGYNVPMGPQPFSVAITGNLSVDRIFRSGFEAGGG